MEANNKRFEISKKGALPIYSEVELVEPMFKNRFLVNFPKEMKIKPFQIKKVYLSIQKDNKWGDVEVELHDYIANSNSKTFFDLFITQSKFLNKIKKRLFKRNILFSFDILITDPTEIAIQKWEIDVEKISHINHGVLEYNRTELKEISVLFKIKNCKLKTIVN